MRHLWSEDIQIPQKEENFIWGKNNFNTEAITERKHQVNIRTFYPVSIVLVWQLAPNIQLTIPLEFQV